MAQGIPFLTTLEAGYAAVEAIRALSHRGEDVLCLQELAAAGGDEAFGLY